MTSSFRSSASIVAQGMFQLREIVNQMEREVCQYLEWGLNIDPATLKEFEDMVCKDFPPHHPPPYHLPPPPVASPIAVQRAMVLFTQCTVRAFTALIQLAPRDSLALIIYVVAHLICVTPPQSASRIFLSRSCWLPHRRGTRSYQNTFTHHQPKARCSPSPPP